jgi:hypothetical protein
MLHSRHSTEPDVLLCEVQAARALSLSSRTLQSWRLRGVGPAFVRAGRAIRYRRADLDRWISENLVQPTVGGAQ